MPTETPIMFGYLLGIRTLSEPWLLMAELHFGKLRYDRVVYSVVLDPKRNQTMSDLINGTVRIWSLATGKALHTLTGHSSLVGLLGLSPTHLVSAATDSTLRIWDPAPGTLQHTLSAHTGATTCFQHDECKVLSGLDGTLKIWDVREGSIVRELFTGITGVWQVVFEGRCCVAASNRQEQTYLDVWDFGGEDPENEFEAEEGDCMEASKDESEQEDGDDDIAVVDEDRDLELRDEDEEEEVDNEDHGTYPTQYRRGSSLQHHESFTLTAGELLFRSEDTKAANGPSP